MYSINSLQKVVVAIILAGALSVVLCKGGGASPSLTSSGVYLGTFPGNTYGNPAWDTSLRAVHDYEKLTASKPNYIVVYHAFSDNGSFISLPSAISTLVGGGYVPVITWEAQDYPTGRIYTPHDIAAGTYDSYIRSYARQVAALKGEVDIRLFHEQNGDWYGWGVGKSGASNQDHINAWRHIHDIFRSEGATNAKYVFNPNERHTAWTDSHPYADYYPGDAYVDYLALDGYNWADVHSAPWYSFDQLFSSSYSELTALSSSRPVMIAEYASHTKTGDKAQWIKDTRDVVKSGKYPQIKALLWFESNQDGALWRLDTSQASLDAYRALAADSYYKGTSIVDASKPTGTLSINKGATTTRSRYVTLYTRASDPAPASGVAYMRFKNYPSTTWSGWFPYASSKFWRLTAEKGTKYVYVQYKDRAGHMSTQAWDSIKHAP
jgi:Glycosyl hydrolase family 26